MHYYNPKTEINVMKDKQGKFISGWKLGDEQRPIFEKTGKLGGGMMLGECYKNCMFYYQVMQDFLNGKITALELQKKYWHQRDIDLEQEQKKVAAMKPMLEK